MRTSSESPLVELSYQIWHLWTFGSSDKPKRSYWVNHSNCEKTFQMQLKELNEFNPRMLNSIFNDWMMRFRRWIYPKGDSFK